MAIFLDNFWVMIVLDVCYFMNHMPSFVLNKKIHYSILFPSSPLTLEVFAFIYFVHNFSPKLNKMSGQSHKCAFSGYFSSQKGYKESLFSTGCPITFLLRLSQNPPSPHLSLIPRTCLVYTRPTTLVLSLPTTIVASHWASY